MPCMVESVGPGSYPGPMPPAPTAPATAPANFPAGAPNTTLGQITMIVAGDAGVQLNYPGIVVQRR